MNGISGIIYSHNSLHAVQSKKMCNVLALDDSKDIPMSIEDREPKAFCNGLMNDCWFRIWYEYRE